MKLVIIGIVLVAAFSEICNAQNLQIPTDAELEEFLNNPETVSAIVDCVIAFDPATCDSRLKEAAELAPEYFSRGGSCPTCSEDVLRRVRKFLQRLQRKYRKDYQRLINAVVA